MQKETTQGTLAYFKKNCREHHLKITPQRTAIYRELIKSKNHPSADAMFQIIRKEFPHISIDTVNRTLLTFSEIGIIDVVEAKGAPRRFDPNMNSHHHCHCVKCGKIIDFHNDAYDKLEVPKNIQRQFSVQSKRVILNGFCSECRRKE